MDIYCINDFKQEFDRLIANKSYRSLEQEIINYFFNKPLPELLSGTRLNQSDTEPYIKKRLKGSGGYRFYFLVIIKKESLYLLFVHPKTGSMGASNITDQSKALLQKKLCDGIKSNSLFLVTIEEEKLLFTQTGGES